MSDKPIRDPRNDCRNGTRRDRPQRNNRSSGIAGITVYVNADRRADPPREYVRIGVFYGSHGAKRVKHFEVGRVGRIIMADVERALREAKVFRKRV